MSTAALRATLVLGAIALGIFVLARAFPTGAGGTPPIATETTQSPSPPEEEPEDGNGGGGTDETTPPPPDVSGLEIQVLNGTGISGLAECTAGELERLEGFQDVIFGDASGSSYPRSQIHYRKDAKDAADYLKATYFKRAQLETAVAGTDVQLSIILGDEYGNRPLRGCR